MHKTRKGISKIFILFLVFILLVISAIIFGYSSGNNNEIKLQMKDRVDNTIEKNSEKVVNEAINKGKETIGEKLIETGEKILER